MIYAVEYTEKAAAKRDALPPDRRAKFEEGIALLAQDPFLLSQFIGSDWWEVRLTSQVMIEYSVHAGRLVIVVVRIFDDKDILVD